MGNLIRTPVLNNYYPFVKEETIIFMKTGHMENEVGLALHLF